MYGFPNGFVEHELGEATTRNWTTVTRIARLFGEIDIDTPARRSG